jgi:hypothetical protein
MKYKLTREAMHSALHSYVLLLVFSHAVVFSKPVSFFIVEIGYNFGLL